MMQPLSAPSFVGSLALLSVKSSMEQTQPTQTYSTLLTPLRLAQQETLSVWSWGSNSTRQLNTITLCLQLLEISPSRCKGTS